MNPTDLPMPGSVLPIFAIRPVLAGALAHQAVLIGS
jgi:hypothetical protein